MCTTVAHAPFDLQIILGTLRCNLTIQPFTFIIFAEFISMSIKYFFHWFLRFLFNCPLIAHTWQKRICCKLEILKCFSSSAYTQHLCADCRMKHFCGHTWASKWKKNNFYIFEHITFIIQFVIKTPINNCDKQIKKCSA